MDTEIDTSRMTTDIEALLTHITELENGSHMMALNCAVETEKLIKLPTNDAIELKRMLDLLNWAKDDFETLNRLATALMINVYPRLQVLITKLHNHGSK